MAEVTLAFAKKISEIFKNSYAGLIRNDNFEVVQTDYTRVPFGIANIKQSSQYIYVENNERIVFPTSQTIWGTITKIGLYEKVKHGNSFAIFDLEQPVNIVVGYQYFILPTRLHLLFIKRQQNR